jgi:hypothetical protein
MYNLNYAPTTLGVKSRKEIICGGTRTIKAECHCSIWIPNYISDHSSWLSVIMEPLFSVRYAFIDSKFVAVTVSRQPLAAEARVWSRVGPCGICGGQSGTGTGFSPSISGFSFNIIPPIFHTLLHLHFLTRRTKGWSLVTFQKAMHFRK